MQFEDFMLNAVQISVTTAVVIAALLLLRKVLHRRYPARLLCFVWLALAVRLLIPVQLTLPQPAVTITPPTYHVRYAQSSPEWYAITEGFAASEGVSTWVTRGHALQNDAVTGVTYWGNILTVIWLLVAGVLLSNRVCAYFDFKKLVWKTARMVQDPVLRVAFEKERARLGMTREIRLIQSDAADCPMLLGLRNPILLLPAGGVDEADAAFIFCHELTHLKHGDLPLKWLLMLVSVMHWFNPLVHLMVRSASQDMELACDSAVARDFSAAEKKQYGETLLRSVSGQLSRRQTLLSRFSGDQNSLMQRFQSLFDTTIKRRGGAFLLMVVLAVALVGGSIAIRQDADAAPMRDAGAADHPAPQPSSVTATEEQTAQQLAELADRWGDAMMERSAKPMYEMLATAQAEQLYAQQQKELGGIDPDHTMGDAQRENALWNIGVSSPWVNGYTVQAVDAAALEATLVYNWHITGSVDWRSATRLTFVRENGVLQVTDVQQLVPDTDLGKTDTIEKFSLLYANDLGIPEVQQYFNAYTKQIPSEQAEIDWSDPAQAAIASYHLSGGNVTGTRDYYAAEKSVDTIVTYTFADGSTVNIQVGDWTFADGSNTRTAMDLAQQWARAMEYKSGLIRYPIFSERLRPQLVEDRREESGDGDVYWKIGGSSPTVDQWIVLPTDHPASLRVVYAGWTSEPREYRYDETLIIDKEANGKLAIMGTDQGFGYPEYAETSSRELFLRLYDNPLGLPRYNEERTQRLCEHGHLAMPEEAIRYVLNLTKDVPVRDVRVHPTEQTVQATIAFIDGDIEVILEDQGTADAPCWMPLSWSEVTTDDAPPAE